MGKHETNNGVQTDSNSAASHSSPLITKLHHHAALATHGSGGTSEGRISVPQHNKDAYRDKEVDQVCPADSMD
jgi:hypothetical protein